MAALTGVLRRPTGYNGLWSWITTVDHKRIGVLYLYSALFFFVIGGLEALLIRSQLAVPGGTVVRPEAYNQLFGMHALTMIFLALMPLFSSFFNIVIPLQIGARDVAFPRLNALSYWVFLFGGLFLNASWLIGAAPENGWFAYANLTEKSFSPGRGMDFYVLGLMVLGISSLAAAFNFIVTIINMRAPGMSLMRMPAFTWMTLLTAFLIIFAFPVITVALIELGFDRFFGAKFFAPDVGGDPLLWQHLFWIFGHPEVYILIIPSMGIVSEVLPTFSRKPLFGYSVVVYSGMVIGFLGWFVWSHHMFTVGLGPVANSFFSLATMLIAIPTGVKIFNWIGTMWGGSLSFKTPMLFALGFIALFIIGGLSGVSQASAPSDYQTQDTYYVVAHIHYVLFGGSLFGIFAGIYYWFPKITGRLLGEGLGKLNFWLMFVGMNLTFAPMHLLGLEGMPRRIYTYPSGMGWELWNFVATIGAFTIALGTLVFIINLLVSLRSGERASNDPWDGRTLEWSIPSPPPIYNFERIPTVHGRDAFWEEKYGRLDEHGLPAQAGGSEHRTSSQGEGEHGSHSIHMPSPSYFPIVTALGLTLLMAGMVSHIIVSGLGLLTMLIGIYGWCFEPTSEEVQPH